jgi:teichuronic acid biosynthesis glycosyltransferase TuaG
MTSFNFSGTPLVSIVIPHFNNVRYLYQALVSIKNQTYPNIEVIIVDDSSDASCNPSFESILKTFPFARIIFNKSNIGVSSSRNVGVEHAVGFFLIFLDSDDFFYSSNKIASEVSLFFKHSSSSKRPIVVYSRVHLCNDSGTILTSISPFFTALPQLYLIFGTMLPRDYLMQRSAFSNSIFFDPNTNFYEDWLFRIKLCSRFDFVYSSTTYTCYRQSNNASNLSRQKTLFPKLRYMLYTFLAYSRDLSMPDRLLAFIILLAYHIHVFILCLPFRHPDRSQLNQIV